MSEPMSLPTPIFATTHWSVVRSAGQEPSPLAEAAVEQLCRAYWYPLYAYVRRRGHDADEAKDLTQEFFARLLAKQRLREASRERGRFRSFLLGAMNNFLADEWEYARTQRRGGGVTLLPLDDVEARFEMEMVSTEPEATFFDQRWARTIMERAMTALKEEFTAGGKGAQFARLKRFLTESAEEKDYAPVAAELQMKPGTVAVLVHRMRQQYRAKVRAEIGQTVDSPAEIEDEMRQLLAVVVR